MTLLFILFALGYASMFFQGPAATTLVISAWVSRLRDQKVIQKPLAFDETQTIELELSEPPVKREDLLRWGLTFTTMGAALDWVVIIQEYLDKDPATIAPSTYEVTETLTKVVCFVSGVAVVLSAIGQGKGKKRTLVTALGLCLASFAMTVLQSCRHMSF